MYRKRVKKSRDKKYFSKTARKRNKKNYRIDRGGIRL